jgi:ABC-type transport system involved in cytochrome c biogenesis permease subunit
MRDLLASILVLALAAAATAATTSPATASAPAQRPAGDEIFAGEFIDFAARLDLSRLELLAVPHAGRLAPLDTAARDRLAELCGDQRPGGVSPTAALLELHFGRELYADAPLEYVRESSLRRVIAPDLPLELRGSFERTGRLPPAYVEAVLAGRRHDALAQRLHQHDDDPTARRIITRLAAQQRAFDTLGDEPPAGQQSAELWNALRQAWLARDPAAASTLARQLADAAEAAAGPAPSTAVRRLELVYNRLGRGTPLWAAFAVASAAYIAFLASRKRWLGVAGLVAMSAATGLLAASFIVRWIISGQGWHMPPILNQFEAITGSALLAALVATVLELARGRGVLGLAASLYATAALLGGFIFPQHMGSGIAMPAGILNSPIMSAHVAIIIVGHALVGMTAVLSVAYLLAAAAGRLAAGRSETRPSLRESIDRGNLLVAQLAAWTVAVGTILGAVWADFAWGRWWGWDIKETWALITALIYIGILHVRMAAPPASRGWLTAVLCLLGAAAMLFNWLAVNYLFAGLHSYA